MGDDIVLGLFGQDDEECAVPGDADDEVAVPLRVRLRVDEDVPIDDVVLDVEAVEPVEEGAEHGDELHAVLGLGEDLRGDFLVEEDASGDAAGVQLRDGLEHRRRPVGVGAVAKRKGPEDVVEEGRYVEDR